jgi:hypothetical protein
MNERVTVNHEKEACLGLSTLEVTQRIVSSNPDIQTVSLRPYCYIPNHTSGSEEKIYGISREVFLGIMQVGLDEWANASGQDYNIALDSSVVMKDGRRGHLILADLAPTKSDENLEKIKNQFAKIIQPEYGGGFFLETNRSYHFVGENIVDQEEWNKLLGKMLITSIVTVTPEGMPNLHDVIVDYRYVGHSLIRGTSGLRLTTKGGKKVSPCVAGFI